MIDSTMRLAEPHSLAELELHRLGLTLELDGLHSCNDGGWHSTRHIVYSQFRYSASCNDLQGNGVNALIQDRHVQTVSDR
jgi:hypothetical protein